MIETVLRVFFFISLGFLCVFLGLVILAERKRSLDKGNLVAFGIITSFFLVLAFGIPLKLITSTSIDKSKESVYCRPLKLRRRVKKMCKDQIFMSLSGDLCNLKCKEN